MSRLQLMANFTESQQAVKWKVRLEKNQLKGLNMIMMLSSI